MAWFYGEPGHGRVLVNAMRSFVCKGLLITEESKITEDKWYDTVSEIYEYLKS